MTIPSANFSDAKNLKILAIDTSMDACSAALLIDDAIFSKYEYAPKQQTKRILPMLENLLSDCELALTDLNLISFANGPGGFTGARIAAAVTQGLALGANIPVLGISTLQAIAQGIYRQYNAPNVLVCLDARMQQVYWSVYQLGEKQIMEAVVPDNIYYPDHIPSISLQNYFATGDGWLSFGEKIKQQLQITIDKVIEDFNPHAEDIAHLAKVQFLKGHFYSAEQALPIYLKGTSNWKKITER